MPAKPLTKEQLNDAARLRAAFDEAKSKNPSMTQETLAMSCGWKTQGAVSQYLNGKIPLNLKALLRFSDQLGKSPEEISPSLSTDLGLLPSSNTHNESNKPKFDINVKNTAFGMRAIPVISYVQAGLLSEISDAYAPGDGFATEICEDDLGSSSFALEIEGDSMLPDFRQGDRIIIDPDVSPNPGDFVVAKNGKHEATFKKYRPRGTNESGVQVFELVPLNDDYPTLRSDIDQLHIIGTMVEHRKKFRRK